MSSLASIIGDSWSQRKYEEQLLLIRKIREERHTTKPSVVKRTTKARKSKAQKLLDALPPQEREEYIKQLKASQSNVQEKEDKDGN